MIGEAVDECGESRKNQRGAALQPGPSFFIGFFEEKG
jgi:hypothetical protein